MFAAVNPAEWGAADVGISVPLPDGRSIWLWGDTYSTGNGFVHSTAITQDRGCLHVSHQGAQLLPNNDAAHIYWIERGVAADPAHISITARAVVLTGTGPWDFADGGYNRTALAAVSPVGDVTFVRWTGRHVTPPPDPGQWGPGTTQTHYVYARHTHPEARLASGLTLVTWCQNWATLHPLADYRPIWSEQ